MIFEPEVGLVLVLALASSAVEAQKVIININGNWRLDFRFSSMKYGIWNMKSIAASMSI